jgi:RNA polymerase sigma factor (sigma-70 family)
MTRDPSDKRGARLEEISTEWTIVRDPGRFVRRYAPAVQRYFTALVKNAHDAEEVAQDFFLRVAQVGFLHVGEQGGRFRDYLKAAVRNAALNFLRRRRGPGFVGREALQATPDPRQTAPDRQWLTEWRRCLLDRACQALARRQRRSPGNLFHTALGLIVDDPLADSQTLAARAGALLGHPLSTGAFRMQVSRARRALALLLAKEVAHTMHRPTPTQVREELIELALWEYVRDYLPDDWATNARWLSAE